MVVEEFRVRLSGVEKELVSNPEKWFLKIPEKISDSFVTALEGWSKRHPADRCPRTRAKNAKSQKGYRLQKLVTSLLRSDKRQPPLCIFCFDNGSDTNELCGRLRWCPDIPLFFAIHELCALMTPEVLTVDNPTPLGKELFETDINQLHAAFVRGRTLICSVCHEKGAGIGCCSTSCRRVFHLPCAIRSMCYLDYEEFRCFCSKHSTAAFEKTTASLFSLDLKKESEDLCCLCMDKVQPKINLHSVIQMDCCGLRFYHFDCMQHASLVRGQEMRCPACNRPNEETCFEERLKRQGIYLQTYNPVTEPGDDGLDSNVRSRCYYAMRRCSAKSRSCVSTIGPDRYDDSDALNDDVFNPHEALNACITCGVHCHRICAGPPWSTYTPEDDGDEEKWQCDECRETSSHMERINTTSAPSFPRTAAGGNWETVNNSHSDRNSSAATNRSPLGDINLEMHVNEQSDHFPHRAKKVGKKRAHDSNAENSSTVEAPLKKQTLPRGWFALAFSSQR
uniref:PHD-type domain-containing protein n=1 Tax=Haemonchus contortus TaxID=6289 RepID=A0A7I4YKK3_HAECO|nr:G2/M-phase specific E3 ubiquitin ligase [Haemonchus contortus]